MVFTRGQKCKLILRFSEAIQTHSQVLEACDYVRTDTGIEALFRETSVRTINATETHDALKNLEMWWLSQVAVGNPKMTHEPHVLKVISSNYPGNYLNRNGKTRFAVA